MNNLEKIALIIKLLKEEERELIRCLRVQKKY